MTRSAAPAASTSAGWLRTALAERMDDGVLMLFDAGGYALALKETDEPIGLAGLLPLLPRGRREPEQVRAFRERSRAGARPLPPSRTSLAYVSWRRDPDGYVAELAWEPD